MKLQVELHPKALRFVIDAIDHQIGALERSLGGGNLSDDASSDASNDLSYYMAIREDLLSVQARAMPGTPPEGLTTNAGNRASRKRA
jgi:hypothetical protein